MKEEHKAELEKASAFSAEEKDRLEGQAKKYQDLLASAETQATSTQQELDGLKGKAKAWMSELDKINSAMARKFFHLHLRPTCSTCRHFSFFQRSFPFFQSTFLTPNLPPRLPSTRSEVKEPRPAPYLRFGRLRTI